MTSPQVNFKGWAEAVSSVDPHLPPKPGYKRQMDLAKEHNIDVVKMRHSLSRLIAAGRVDVIAVGRVKWYKLK